LLRSVTQRYRRRFTSNSYRRKQCRTRLFSESLIVTLFSLVLMLFSPNRTRLKRGLTFIETYVPLGQLSLTHRMFLNLRGSLHIRRLRNPHHLIAFLISPTLVPSVYSQTHGPRCSMPKTPRVCIRSSLGNTANLSGISPSDVLQIIHWQVDRVYQRRGLYHYLEDLPPPLEGKSNGARKRRARREAREAQERERVEGGFQ
jgi:hypothetical protein